jgi:flagellar biosynthesis/type III secretory pathway protein FliH
MSVERIIRAHRAEHHTIESFPYFTAHFSNPLPEDADDNDAPLGAALSTPEEDAKRLASVDQVIYEKLQQAERDALDTARRGYEEGFAAGETEGRQFGESQYRTHIQRLDGHLQELSTALSLRERAAQDEMIALALAIGEYLAGRAIEHGAATIQPLLEAVLTAHPFPGASENPDAAVTIHLNPKDLEALGAGSHLHPGVALQEDAELSRGSLRVEAATGVVDATLEDRVKRLMVLVDRFREGEAL